MEHFIWQRLLLGSSLWHTVLASTTPGATYEAKVETANAGLIIGHQAPETPAVFDFLGIPYAEAPVGERRLAAPVKRQIASNATFNASTWVRDFFLCKKRAV